MNHEITVGHFVDLILLCNVHMHVHSTETNTYFHSVQEK